MASVLLGLLAAACPDNSPTTPTPPPPPSTAPTIVAVSPSSGSTLGATNITITGTNFATGATVLIGGVPATSVTVVGTTDIQAATGAHAAGLADVVVTVGTQSATLASGFTYVAPPPPTITAIAPTSGSTAGGTTVAIAGTNFATGTTGTGTDLPTVMMVTIGGVTATNLTVVSSTTLLAVTGARGAGAADVVVTVGAQSATLPNGFTFVAPVVNSLPVITSLTIQGTRSNEPANFADVGEEVVVTAAVRDAETPIDKLLFEWTADGGVFTGSGLSVRWRAPATLVRPTQFRVTLKVTETLEGVLTGGFPSATTQSVTASSSVRLHDSIREIRDLSVNFLLEFSNSSLTPEFVVRNFWNGPGKDAELLDVADNRKNFLITGYRIGEPTSVAVNFGGVCALNERGDGCAVVPCEWNDIYKPLNEPGTATGTCYLSTVYRDSLWWLSSSRWQGTSTHPPRFGVTFIR